MWGELIFTCSVFRFSILRQEARGGNYITCEKLVRFFDELYEDKHRLS
jgi:hypothetical protein